MKKLLFLSAILFSLGASAQTKTLTTSHCQTKTRVINVTEDQSDVFIITDTEITQHSNGKTWTRYVVTAKKTLASAETMYVCKEGSDNYNILLLANGTVIEIDKQGADIESKVYSNLK